MQEILAQLLQTILPVLSLIITGYILPKLSAWLKAKTHHELIQSVITDITTTAATTVNYLDQVVVKQLKSDGKWDSEQQAEMLQSAIDQVLVNLSATTKSYLESQDADIEATIERYIESAIREDRAKGGV